MKKQNETMYMIAALLAFAILFLLPMLALAIDGMPCTTTPQSNSPVGHTHYEND
jgi:hypothetical protein